MIGRPPTESVEEYPGPTPEALRILAWREEVLTRAGYNDLQAKILAQASHVDLHEAVALVQSGCPPLKAARILL